MCHFLVRVKLNYSLEIEKCLGQEADFEHDYSVREPTQKIIGVDGQALMQRLYCESQVITEAVLARLYEIRDGALAWTVNGSFNWYGPNCCADRI